VVIGQILTSGPERCVTCGKMMSIEELGAAVFCLSRHGAITACSFQCMLDYLKSLKGSEPKMYQFGETPETPDPIDMFLKKVNLLKKLGYKEKKLDSDDNTAGSTR
jgi:hypothetical protein